MKKTKQSVLLQYYHPDAIECFNYKQKRVIEQYDSPDKLQDVLAWRIRVKRCDLNISDLAAAMDVPQPRVSEWILLLVQPSDETFKRVETVLEGWEQV